MCERNQFRYNELGHWKPIVYDGNTNLIEEEIRYLSNDLKIQGILFYIRTTNYLTIEFVMKTEINLPIKDVIILDKRLHIYKCPKDSKIQESYLYDCWLDLGTGTPEDIEAGLYLIRLAVNRIGLAFNNSVQWCLKYGNPISKQGSAQIEKEEIEYLSRILTATVSRNDMQAMEYAIDWYNQGNKSQNSFTSFICYYNSVEYIASMISSGKTNFNSKKIRMTRNEKIRCIMEKEAVLRENKPLKFIQSAYEECLKGTKFKLKHVFDIVFGENHEYIELLIAGDESLLFIRNQIAHGVFSLIDSEHIKIVKNHLHEMEEIAHQFLLRLLLEKGPTERLPSWGGKYILTMSFSNPSSIKTVSREEMLSNKDWTILPEWCTNAE